MKTLEQLTAMIEGGQTVIVGTEHVSTVAALKAAYPAAKEAYDAAQAAQVSPLAAAVTELKAYQSPGVVSREEFESLRARIDGAPAPSGDTVSRAEYDALQGKIANDYVLKTTHNALKTAHANLQASVEKDLVPRADAEALATRNGAQADLLSALIGDEADLKKLTAEHLRAVAEFEGVQPGENREATLAAILAKRSG